jgi:translation initiation factor IF-2
MQRLKKRKKMKVSEIAGELGYKAKELWEIAKSSGIEIKSYRSVIDEKTASLIRSKIKPKEGKKQIGRTSTKPKKPKTLIKAKVQESEPLVIEKAAEPKGSSITVDTKQPSQIEVESPSTVKVKPEAVSPSETDKIAQQKGLAVPVETKTVIHPEDRLKPTPVTKTDIDVSILPYKPTKEERRFIPRERVTKQILKKPAVVEVLEKPITIEKKEVEVGLPITLKEFSQVVGIKLNIIIKKLLEKSIIANINSRLDEKVILLIGKEFGLQVRIKKPKPLEEEIVDLELKEQDKKEDLIPRAPVVVFLGHVDHGKTSLLDRIRKTKVAQTEAGGITQHIGAYKVILDSNKSVVFLDTPGHEAFTAMRARGTKITDVAVLVVAADDGVMPQTEEAINHAHAAGVPIVVAINKIDKKTANPNRVKHQLAQLGLVPEDWGGNTVFVEVSALTGANVEHLVEMLSLEAELLELKANPKRQASGIVIEAKKLEGRGIVATLLVQNGTLRRGDAILCGQAFGRVKTIHDDRGRVLLDAPPSTPVEISGLDCFPEAGDRFVAVKNLELAKALAEERKTKLRDALLGERSHVSLENLFEHIESGKIKEIKVILKADVKGSIEVIRESLKNLSTEKIKIRFMHAGVGNINESDVLLADVSDALILGFSVLVEERAKVLAKEKGVDIKLYDVIYEAIDEMKLALEGMLEPEKIEVKIGRCVVKEVFKISKIGNIAGCLVTDGKIERSSLVRVIRDGKNIHNDGKLSSLKRFKDDVSDVNAGLECGLKISGFENIIPGDIIEAYRMEDGVKKRQS